MLLHTPLNRWLYCETLINSIGPSRCFPFWQELLACYVINTSSGDGSGQKMCVPAMEDYYECLHHKKEVCKADSQYIATKRGSNSI